MKKLENELKNETDGELLMDYLSNLNTINPTGNVPLGDPQGNPVRLASLAISVKSRVDLRDAFGEVFGMKIREQVLKGLI